VDVQEMQNEVEFEDGKKPAYIKYVKALRWAIAVLCVAWIGMYFCKHQQYLHLFSSLSVPRIIALLGMAAVHLLLYALQFYLVLRTCTNQYFSFFAFFKTIILGRIFSNIAPQGGNVYRAVYFKYKFGISYTHYLSGFFCFLWIDAAMNIILSAVIFGVFAPTFHIHKISIWLVLLVLAAMWFLPIGFEVLFGRISFRSRGLVWLHSRASKLLSISVESLSNIRMLCAVIAANIVNFANNALFFYLCFSAFGVSVAISVLMMFFILMKVTSYLILTPGNLGFREVAYAFLGQQVGLEAGQGIVLSLFHRFAVLLVVILLAVYFEGSKLFRKDKQVSGSACRKS
jgi:uncharacterized membrane protein YbhN (UPF0104 family)